LSAGEDIQAALDAARAEYAAELPDLVRALLARIEQAAADEARSQAHRLRGTAGSYGFAAVSDVAGRIEDALDAGRAVEPDLLRELAALADQAADGSSRSSK
jgi:HPt (histidine-containing phosphotransfer) domain-containing protein